MSNETPTINGKTAAPEVPKRRGRPPGAKNAPKAEVLSEQPVSGDAPKRGRPRKGPTIPFDREALARSLKGTHGTLAFFLGMPELMISEAEAVELAGAFADFAREFDFEPNPKVLATVNLIGVAGIVYVPRVVKVSQRVRAQKLARKSTVDSAPSTPDTPVHDTSVN